MRISKHERVIYLRMFMYTLTISLHVANVGITHLWCFKIVDDPELNQLYPLWTRLFTVWNIVMQIVHAVIGLVCDRDELNNTKIGSSKLNSLKNFNSTFFSAVVWPSAWVCSATFWFVFNYDKNLLRYSLMKKLMNPVTNHIGHTFILVVVVWELILRPTPEPKSHRKNFYCLSTLAVLYIGALWYTYMRSGTWVYPFLDISYGTVYFPLIHMATCLIALAAYYAQWPISKITLLETVFGKDKRRLMKLRLQKILQ